MNELHEQRRQTLDELLRVVVQLGDDMQTALARQGLSVPRAHLLWLVHQHGPLTQRALADRMDVSPRNVTGLVDGLVETGFVTREPHPADRRATLVSLTEHAATTLAAMDEEHGGLADALFGDLPVRRLASLRAGLRHVTEALERELE